MIFYVILGKMKEVSGSFSVVLPLLSVALMISWILHYSTYVFQIVHILGWGAAFFYIFPSVQQGISFLEAVFPTCGCRFFRAKVDVRVDRERLCAAHNWCPFGAPKSHPHFSGGTMVGWLHAANSEGQERHKELANQHHLDLQKQEGKQAKDLRFSQIYVYLLSSVDVRSLSCLISKQEEIAL